MSTLAGIKPGTFGDRHWKSPVANAAALPSTGNSAGDARKTLDDQHEHVWTGSAWVDETVAGSQGPQGPQGDPGPTGAAGRDGATWTSGAGVPSGGADGDYYLRTSNGDVYERSVGSWAVVANITGPTGAAGADGAAGAQGAAGSAGADGKTVRNGSGAPSSGIGVDGDYYIDNAAHSIYGPKTSGSWGSGTSLIGPAGSGGGSSTVVPTDFSSLKIWLKASAITGLADGDPIASWPDSSGNGNHFVQSTGGWQPLYRTTGMLVPAAQFDGIHSCMSAPSITLSSFSIFVVFAATNAGVIYEHSPSANDNNGSYLFTTYNATIRVTRTQSSLRELVPVNFSGTPIAWGADNQWHIALHSFEETFRRHRFFVDGAWPLMNNMGSSSPLTGSVTDTMYLGSRANSSAFLAALIPEFVVFSPALNAAESEQMVSYLKAANSI